MKQCPQDIDHQAVKNSDPWEMEINEVTPTITSAYCLE